MNFRFLKSAEKANEIQFQLIVLVEILLTFDFADEVGRQNFLDSIPHILSPKNTLASSIVAKLMDCVGRILSEHDARLQFVVEMLRDVIIPKPVGLIDFTDNTIVKIIEGIKNDGLKLKVCRLKLQMLDLREKKEIAIANNEYADLDQIGFNLMSTNKDVVGLLLLASNTESLRLYDHEPTKMTNQSIERCLQMLHITLKASESMSIHLTSFYQVRHG